MVNAFTNAAASMIQQILKLTRDFLNKYDFGDEGPAGSFGGVSPPPPHTAYKWILTWSQTSLPGLLGVHGGPAGGNSLLSAIAKISPQLCPHVLLLLHWFCVLC